MTNPVGRQTQSLCCLLTVCLWMLPIAGLAVEPSAEPTDTRTRWLPENANFVATLNLAKFWDGPEKDLLREVSGLHPFVISWWLKDATAASGLRPEEVPRITISDEPSAGWIACVETKDPNESNTLRQKLVGNVPPTSFNEIRYYANEQYSVFQIVPEATLVATPPDVIRSTLTRMSRQPDPTVPSFPARDNDALLDVYIRAASLRDKFAAGGIPQWLSAIAKARFIRATILPANDLTLRLVAEFPDDASAEVGAEQIGELMRQLEKYLEMCQTNMPPAIARFAAEYPGAGKLAPLIDEATKAGRNGFKAAKVTRQGSAVSAVVKIETPRPVTDAILLLSLSPRGSR